MVAAARKFLFDLSFDAPPPETAAAAAAARQAAAAELAQARDAALAEGRAAGLAEASRLAEARIAATLDAAVAELKELARNHDRKLAEIERAAAELTAAILARLLPSLAQRSALHDIAALVAQCLGEAADEPRIVLRVADDLFEAARDRIAPLAGAAGFAGKLVILGDEALGPADARVEWADGGVERDFARLARDLESAALRLVDTPRSDPAASPGETP
jgi:flagellar assembly protein FliH